MDSVESVKQLFINECIDMHLAKLTESVSSDTSSENNIEVEEDFFADLRNVSSNSASDFEMSKTNFAESQSLNFLNDKHKTRD